MPTSNLSICVYCGSRDGKNQDYGQVAVNLGTALAQNNYRLVYGAGDVGLMGRVADACLNSGGEVLGVIPEHLFKLEVGKENITHMVVTETMHERKKVMAMNADAFIVLPGGFGTLDEFFEILTWRQLSIHEKPIILLNVGGFWDPLVQLLNAQVNEGFASKENLNYVSVCDDVEAAIAVLPRVS